MKAFRLAVLTAALVLSALDAAPVLGQMVVSEEALSAEAGPQSQTAQEPALEPQASATEQEAQSEDSESEDVPGNFAIGGNLWLEGGVIPAVHYNLNDRVTVEGSIGLYSAVTMIGVQAFYRFTRPVDQGASVTFEPVAGGGLSMVTVSLLGESETLVGYSASGGVFVHLPKHPHWRFKGVLTLVQFDYEGSSLRGLGSSLGAFYFF